jgi:xylulokinase
MEGGAYATRHNLEIAENSCAVQVRDVKLCGGGSTSGIWRKIMADVLKKRVSTIQVTDTEPLGSAFIAGKGVGLYKSYEETSALVRLKPEVVEPDLLNHAVYSEYFGIYKRLYPQLKGEFAALYELQNKI